MKESICKIYEYEILDSWGASFVCSTAIMDNISLFFQKRCGDHNNFNVSSGKWNICNCKMSVVNGTGRRIQHTRYTTCGWFALYFCTFSDEWLRTKVKYRSIRDNENELYGYFDLTFFKHCYFKYFEMRQCCYLRNRSVVCCDQKCVEPPRN